MTALSWIGEGEPRYELGVRHGVLYPLDSIGVAWNGLINVTNTVVGGERTEAHIDGVKFGNFVGSRDFQAKIKAFSAPEEFRPCVGEVSVRDGFFLTGQPRTRFGLSYQTLIGTVGYRIHLVYNAIVTPSSKSYTTMGESVAPLELEWTIDTVPPSFEGLRPTAHLVIDSTKTPAPVLSALELLLYGDVGVDPGLPTFETVVDIFAGGV